MSQTAFLEHVVHSPITNLPGHINDSLTLRAVLVFQHYGVADVVEKCSACGKAAQLAQRSRGTFDWVCSKSGHNHMQEPMATSGILAHIPQSSWMAFLNFIALLKLGRPLHDIYDEILCAHGPNIKPQTMISWRVLYQSQIEQKNEQGGLLKIGKPGDVIVIDETSIGVHAEDGFSIAPKGIRKFSPQVRTGRRDRKSVKKRILKRLPARTVWRASCKRPAAMKRSPALKKRPAARDRQTDKRSNGKLLWAAVVVGNGQVVYTHKDHTKKFTFRIRPKKSEAIKGKPRGFEEIRDTFKLRLNRRTKPVFDKWHGTKKAASELGFKFAKPINHSVEYRDRETGFHSNDIESENNRLKHWCRVRYSRLLISEGDLHEYAYYINVGSSVEAIMKALR